MNPALKAYEDRRLEVTSRIVCTNRQNPPDAIPREVYLRTGDQPFTDIDAVIPRADLVALSESKRVTGHEATVVARG